jgi:hypothetical protein
VDALLAVDCDDVDSLDCEDGEDAEDADDAEDSDELLELYPSELELDELLTCCATLDVEELLDEDEEDELDSASFSSRF